MEAAMLGIRSIAGGVLVASLLSCGYVARADERSAVADAQQVIKRQIDAIARGDAGVAYTLNAPDTRIRFTDAAQFLDMVRDGYKPVVSHRRVEYGGTMMEGDQLAQKLTIVDNANGVWSAFYRLARQPDGHWLIEGCLLIKSSEQEV
jgi:hypothetical protein